MFLRHASSLLRRIRFSCQTVGTAYRTTNSSSFPISSEIRFSCHHGSEAHSYRKHFTGLSLWTIISGQAAIIFGINASLALAEDVSMEVGTGNDTEEANLTSLQKIEDGSVISNTHTSKWRIFTDNGRDLFSQGKLEEAERYFLLALQEAKEGFGNRDPHVASACNNLAELYRVKKAFEKAEPLYLEAINILEESFGPEDVRVGSAYHNLGQFYLVQRILEEARICYERALKIKGRVLGHGHPDYADTMFHLGTVLYLQGKDRDAVAVIQDSIRILEEGGQGESMICVRRLRYLSQILLKCNQLSEAENVQRKILHILELSKGWNSRDTVGAAEALALTLLSVGKLAEAQELLERCLEIRKTLLPEDHIQIAGNMLHLARVAMFNSNELRKVDASEARAELEKAKLRLSNSIRIARQVLDRSTERGSNMQNFVQPKETVKDEHAALVILLQSFDTLGLLEITKKEFQELKDENPPLEAENALRQCVSSFKELGAGRKISNSPEVKTEYLSCLKHLLALINDNTSNRRQPSSRIAVQELKDEIKCVETELTAMRKHKNQFS